jgi:hypothetical protein
MGGDGGESEMHLGPGSYGHPELEEHRVGMEEAGVHYHGHQSHHHSQQHPPPAAARSYSRPLPVPQSHGDHIPCEGDERPINDDDLESGNFVLGCGGTIAAPLQYEEVTVTGADGSVSTVLKPKRGQGYSCHHWSDICSHARALHSLHRSAGTINTIDACADDSLLPLSLCAPCSPHVRLPPQ